MHKPNRKITWAHVTYLADGSIQVLWSGDHWKEGKYVRKHRSKQIIVRERWSRMRRLVYIANNRAGMKYFLPAYNGWSVCWEKIT